MFQVVPDPDEGARIIQVEIQLFSEELSPLRHCHGRHHGLELFQEAVVLAVALVVLLPLLARWVTLRERDQDSSVDPERFRLVSIPLGSVASCRGPFGLGLSIAEPLPAGKRKGPL